MKLFDASIRSLIRRDEDCAVVAGIAGGRVKYLPHAKYLYSVRLFLFMLKIEILWTTGERLSQR